MCFGRAATLRYEVAAAEIGLTPATESFQVLWLFALIAQKETSLTQSAGPLRLFRVHDGHDRRKLMQTM
jgi:hypothetical protein